MENAEDFEIIAMQDALTERASVILSEYNRLLDDNEIDEDETPMDPLVIIKNRILYIYKHIQRLDNANIQKLTEMNGKLSFATEILDDINDESPMGKLF